MKPKLREVEIHPIQHRGQSMLLLRDRLALSGTTIAVPRQLGPLLGLMDGTRDAESLEAALAVRSGVRLAPGLLAKLLADLDGAYLLDNERFWEARAEVLEKYRSGPFRPMSLEGGGFPADPEGAAARLGAYVEALVPGSQAVAVRPVRGLVSPHIDYERGGPVYAQVWAAAAQAVRDAELVILFGTDHQGSDGTLTLTRQSYATPWGVLPTDAQVVGELAGVLGDEAAFGEELNHRTEHSVELAAVWLHFVRQGHPVRLVPILCGGFDAFLRGDGDPAGYPPFAAALGVLDKALRARRTLVVAAADLAHVGPAFGDPYGVDLVQRARQRNADQRLLDAICVGDAAGFFGQLKAEENRRHVCGLPPIYLMLRLLGEAQGEPAGYDLCPADAEGRSIVSIAGALLY